MNSNSSTNGANAADLAEALYSQRPKKYNCAQAVAKAFGRDNLLESLKSCGGGRAPDGFCGALHAALLLLPDEKREAAKQAFRQAAGEVQCRLIRQAGETSCAECVRIAVEVLVKVSNTT